MDPDPSHPTVEVPDPASAVVTSGAPPAPPVPPVPSAGDRQEERAGRPARWLVEWAAVFVGAVLLAVGVRTYVAQMFYIPSGSMLPTLQIGERIVVDKLAYKLGPIHRGDVVVFSRPPLEQANFKDLVKRVIGLPGETIASVDGRITIDGRPLAEPWLPTPPPPSLPSNVAEPFSLQHPFRIPAGEYYVMGDNRTDSADSRYFGPIPADIIVGRMAFKAWPLAPEVWLVALSVVAVGILVTLVVLVARRPRSTPVGPAPPAGP